MPRFLAGNNGAIRTHFFPARIVSNIRRSPKDVHKELCTRGFIGSFIGLPLNLIEFSERRWFVGIIFFQLAHSLFSKNPTATFPRLAMRSTVLRLCSISVLALRKNHHDRASIPQIALAQNLV